MNQGDTAVVCIKNVKVFEELSDALCEYDLVQIASLPTRAK